jgi:CHASE3 domain sensor protein
VTRERPTLDLIIRRAVTLETLLVAAVIGFALAGVLIERSVASAEQRDEETLTDLATFEFQVLNAETGFRGFALSRKEAFLAPYREAFPQITRLRPKLLGVVDKDDKPYMHEALRVISDWRRNFASPAIRDLRRSSGAEARAAIGAGEGKRRIDRIRFLVDRIQAHERHDLEAAADGRRLISQVLIGILALAVVAALAGGLRAASTLRRAVVNPVRRLAETTARIRGGDLSARAEVRGAIEVDSEVGKGSSFRIRLPREPTTAPTRHKTVPQHG